MTPENDSSTMLSPRRKRNPKVALPPSMRKNAREMTESEWQDEQNRLQAKAAESHIKNTETYRANKIAEREARKESNLEKYGRPVTSRSQIIDGVREEDPLPPEQQLPMRGPKIKGRVMENGEVPVRRIKGKSTSRVQQARERARQ